jgi:hypothetical protein
VTRYGLGVPNQRTAGADQRSAFAGVPWWGAILIALTASLVGIAIEAGSGHEELGGIFAACYALGCVAAVFAVRQTGIFTAVIQPPLLLFMTVPLAYYLFHEAAFGGLKDILITCGYPLIERFPLMLFTSAAALLIGLLRWYLAMSAPSRPQAAAPAGPGLLATLTTKLASAFAGNGSVDEEPGARPARPRHVVDRSGTKRQRRPQQRTSSRSRPSRPAVEEFERDAEPRRRTARRDDQWAPEPRRRPREPREPRRTPPPPRRERADQNPPRQPRGSRFEPYEAGRGRFEPYEAGRGHQSHPHYGGGYPPLESRRRSTPNSAADHHPVSRVRYRDSGPSDGPYDAGFDGPPRSRPRR